MTATFEAESIVLLTRIARTLESIDTGITDLVHVVEENADTVKSAMDDAADAIASAVEPKEEEPVCTHSRKVCPIHKVVHGKEQPS